MAIEQDKPSSRKKGIEDARAGLWRELVQLRLAVRNLERSIAALDQYLGVQSLPGGRRPKHFIVAYLTEAGHFVEREELVAALLDRGVVPEVEDRNQAINAAITQSSSHPKIKKKLIQVVARAGHEYVGLKEWKTDDPKHWEKEIIGLP